MVHAAGLLVMEVFRQLRLGACAAEALLLRTRHNGAPFLNKPMDRSFSLRMPYLMQIWLCASNDRS